MEAQWSGSCLCVRKLDERYSNSMNFSHLGRSLSNRCNVLSKFATSRFSARSCRVVLPTYSSLKMRSIVSRDERIVVGMSKRSRWVAPSGGTACKKNGNSLNWLLFILTDVRPLNMALRLSSSRSSSLSGTITCKVNDVYSILWPAMQTGSNSSSLSQTLERKFWKKAGGSFYQNLKKLLKIHQNQKKTTKYCWSTPRPPLRWRENKIQSL